MKEDKTSAGISEMSLLPKDLKERVIERPYYVEWEYPLEDGGGNGRIREKGNLNYEGLNDLEKMILYIYSWNISDICPTRRSVMKNFGWSKYKVSKMYRQLKGFGLESVALFSERTGLLCGRGYRYFYS